MTFPTVVVQLELGGSWVDVTADVLVDDGITIRRGRPNESAQADPASCSLSLRNDGTYSPRNPTGAYYGQLTRNTPLRVQVGSATTPAVRAVASATANGTSVTVTKPTGTTAGDTLLVFHSTNKDISAMTPPSTVEGPWTLLASSSVDPAGTPVATNVWLRTAGSSEPASYVFGQASGADGVIAMAALTGSVSVLASSTQEASPGASFDTPSVVPLSDHDLDLRWVAGNSAATVTFTPPTGYTEQVDAQSNAETAASLATKTLSSSAATGVQTFTASSSAMESAAGFTVLVSSASVRFHGEVSTLPQRWDVSGNDVWVPIQADGILRRLGQGASPLYSPIRRAYTDAGVLAYWPLEDGGEATQLASAISGHPAATLESGSNPADNATLPGSAPLATLHPSGTVNDVLRAVVPAVGLTTQWQAEFFFRIDTVPTTTFVVFQLNTTGTGAFFQLLPYDGAGYRVRAVDADGAVIQNGFGTGVDGGGLVGYWHHCAFAVKQDGANVVWGFAWQAYTDTGSTGVTFATASFAGDLGRPTRMAMQAEPTGATDVPSGHMGIFDAYANFDHWTDPDLGWSGEKAGARFVRLCGEEGVPSRVVGDPYDSEPMGVQRIATLLDLLADVERTDQGILFETRDEPGLSYRTRVARYNAPAILALTYGAAGEVAPPLDPTEDDEPIRNDVTVTRRGASSARAVLESGALSIQPPPGGVGRYDTEVTVDCETDEQLAGMAMWRLHLGTWDEPRYPGIHVDMAALNQAGKTSLIAGAAEVDVGHRLTIADPPLWLPPDTVDQHADGYGETLDSIRWDLVFNGSPAQPWQVATADGDPRVDTDGSTLASGITSAATSLSLASTGALWTTTAADFPLDINIGGEQIRLSAISGTSSPQTATASARSVNGVVKAHSSGAAVNVHRPAIVAL